MKPEELLKDYEKPYNNYYGGRRFCIAKTLARYYDKDCVIAYHKNNFGVMFILKGKREIFYVTVFKSNLKYHFHGFNNAFRIYDAEYNNLCNGQEVIIMQEEYDKLQKIKIINEMAKTE